MGPDYTAPAAPSPMAIKMEIKMEEPDFNGIPSKSRTVSENVMNGESNSGYASCYSAADNNSCYQAAFTPSKTVCPC